MTFHHGFTRIDPAAWSRRRHFELYGRMGFPYIGVTVRLDVTGLSRACADTGRNFFTAFLHAVSQAVNAEENFHYRIHDGGVVLCERTDPAYTVMKRETELFYFATARFLTDFDDFEREVETAKKDALEHEYLANDRVDVFYASCAPWVDFSDLVQPMGIGSGDSVPRLIWGQCRETDGRAEVPLSITAHHGLVDGLHMGRLLEHLRGLLAEPAF